MDSLFDPVAEPERTAFLRRLRALIAPVAADAGSVVDDPALLDIAQSMYAAFGEACASGGLTKAQIATDCFSVRYQSEFGLDPFKHALCLIDGTAGHWSPDLAARAGPVVGVLA